MNICEQPGLRAHATDNAAARSIAAFHDCESATVLLHQVSAAGSGSG